MSNAIHLHYDVSAEDFTRAGEASSDVKKKLKKLGVSPDVIRRVSIALYEGEINMVIHANGGKITILISEDAITMILDDKGPGIKDKSTTALFHPFTKIDDLMNGLGLGLPLCKRHANSLGGDLTLDTDYLEGARFVLEVPK